MNGLLGWGGSDYPGEAFLSPAPRLPPSGQRAGGGADAGGSEPRGAGLGPPAVSPSMAPPGPFHVTGLGIPKTWQPQISYTQLQAPKTSVPGGSQMAAVALVLTHLGGRTPSLLSHAITSLARHHFSRTLLVRGKSRQPAHSQGYKLHSTS